MEARNLRKERTGVVVSNKMDKTIVVAIEDHVKHPLYKKLCSIMPTEFLRERSVQIYCQTVWSI